MHKKCARDETDDALRHEKHLAETLRKQHALTPEKSCLWLFRFYPAHSFLYKRPPSTRRALGSAPPLARLLSRFAFVTRPKLTAFHVELTRVRLAGLIVVLPPPALSRHRAGRSVIFSLSVSLALSLSLANETDSRKSELIMLLLLRSMLIIHSR